ncbi:MAG: hypothetical protein KGN84_21295 [Acidobacteriota bacterium]|nr:hypothetical protein [Acidobacteriota bacterium]
MGKYKAAKKKTDAVTPQMRPGVPCLILVILGGLAVFILMILVMRNAG